MLGTLKNRILIASSYGTYMAAMVFFFDALSFLMPRANSLLIYSALTALVTIVELGVLEWLKSRISKGKSYRILIVLSFYLSGILSSCIVWYFFHSGESSLFLFMITFLIGAIFPTMIVILYFIFNEAKNKIIHSTALDQQQKGLQEAVFCIENEAGKTLLKLPVQQLLCFEANDNYVIIYYFDKNNELKKLMERFSLKKIEEILSLKNVKFERVHKSFLINANFLVAISGKAQAYKLELKGFETLIPVSRSYSISQLEQRLIDNN